MRMCHTCKLCESSLCLTTACRYDGWEIKGKVETTLSQGNIVWNDDKLTAIRGAGRYIKCKPFGSLFEGIDQRPIDANPGSIDACTRIV